MATQRRIESAPGVGDHEGQRPVDVPRGDGHRGTRAAVFGGVLQRLAAAVVQRRLGRRRIPSDAMQVQLRRDRGPRGQVGSASGRPPLMSSAG